MKPAAEMRSGYAWYVLSILTLTYALNFVDRQILSVVATDIKRDLGLRDSDIGFLYGTAFGVFYALFGIPMGRLADSWNRVRLMRIGLSLWSVATALSGAAATGGQLALARFGVGVGEATAAPCAYSLLSDYFPKAKRATALAFYSAGLYLGAGASLFIGGIIVHRWNVAWPDGGPLGLVGWQAAFVVVGLPGLLLAIVMATLREPPRGLSDGIITARVERPFAGFVDELLTIVPPFTLLGARRRGTGALLRNMMAAAAVALAAYVLVRLTGDLLQWAAVALGCYAVFSWASAVRARDPATYALTWGTPVFMILVVGFGIACAAAYAVTFWMLPYAEIALGARKATAGLMIGGGGAAGGFAGSIIGGRIADRWRRSNPSGRIGVLIVVLLVPLPFWILCFTTRHLTLFYALQLPMTVVSGMAIGTVAATIQDLVLPRMRGTATAIMFLGTTMIGLALGPYSAGRISAATGSLGTGVLAVMLLIPVSVVMIAVVYVRLPAAEADIVARARRAGEVIA